MMTHRLLIRCWLLATCCVLTACSMDEDDIRKYAIRRPKDVEAPPPAKPTPADPTHASPAVGTSASPAAIPAAAPPKLGVTSPMATAPEGVPAIDATTLAIPQPVSDTKSPDTSLSEVERRGLSIENMKRIMAAFQQYVADKGVYPAGAILSTTGSPLLSWRVELLPYLGYVPLYQAFHLDEPWTSPHNQALLKAIPSVYQSPERFDENTNYVVPIGSVTAFNGSRALVPSRWEDGRGTTAILVEANNEAAVPWTAPQDLAYSSQNPKVSLFSLRSDGFFVGIDGGAVMRVPPDLDVRDLRALFTIDGGEAFQVGAKCKLAVAQIAGVGQEGSAGQVAMASPANVPNQGRDVASIPSDSPSATYHGAPEGSTTNLAQTARRAYEQGLETSAVRLALAAYLTAEPVASVNYQWIPALKRPATSVRFAIGIDYVGTHSDSVHKQFENISSESSVASSRFTNLLGELSDSLLSQVENSRTFLPPPCQTVDAPNRRSAPATSLYFAGIGSESTLVQACLLNHYDVLLMFRVEERKTRSGIEVKTVKFAVYDVWTHRILLKEQSINYLKRERESKSPLYKDPINAISSSFGKLLNTELQPTALPTVLRPEHAARRAQDLAKLRQPIPLGPLAELKFYRDANLITASEMMATAEQILSRGGAINLLAGSPSERLAAIEAWVPQPQLADLASRPRGNSGGTRLEKQDRDP